MNNPAIPAKGREWLRIEQDKKYGLGYVDSRFEVPYDMPPHPELIRAEGMPVVNKTIEQFERLGGWKYYDKIPPKFYLSALPTRDQLDSFNRMKVDDIAPSVNAWAKPQVVLVARIWFIKPLEVIVEDEDVKNLNEDHGFVSVEDMPEGSLSD